MHLFRCALHIAITAEEFVQLACATCFMCPVHLLLLQ